MFSTRALFCCFQAAAGTVMAWACSVRGALA